MWIIIQQGINSTMIIQKILFIDKHYKIVFALLQRRYYNSFQKKYLFLYGEFSIFVRSGQRCNLQSFYRILRIRLIFLDFLCTFCCRGWRTHNDFVRYLGPRSRFLVPQSNLELYLHCNNNVKCYFLLNNPVLCNIFLAFYLYTKLEFPTLPSILHCTAVIEISIAPPLTCLF